MTGIALVAFRTILAVFSYNLTKVHSAAVSISDDQFSGCIDRRFSNADTVFAVFTVNTIFAILTGITLAAFRAILAVFSYNLTKVHRATVSISDD